MNNKIQNVRGTNDIFGKELKLFNKITEVAKKRSLQYGFQEIFTPIFEFSEIFERNLGDSSDIISKEVYKFQDRSDNSLTLRPEFTASIIRAFINNSSFHSNLPAKLFSYGPVFRYDRPQKGRRRQFHQINFEIIASKHFLNDVEILILAYNILDDLNIVKKSILNINSLGTSEVRSKYEVELAKYLSKFKLDLSEDSKVRLEKNPLRILDSKDKKDQEILLDAPKINNFYDQESKEHLENIIKTLEEKNITYKVNPNLVRGLDYYNGLVFEFVTDEIGSQNTILAGGRYDKLVSQMSGPDLPAIGFAAGMERLSLLMEEKEDNVRPISLIYIGNEQENYTFDIANKIRNLNINLEIVYGKNMKKQMQRANAINSKFAIIIGSDEKEKELFNLKDLDNGNQEALNFNDLIKKIS
ncbi:MAG: histidyl-tRNA synthetase [Ulvibacter sp.]